MLEAEEDGTQRLRKDLRTEEMRDCQAHAQLLRPETVANSVDELLAEAGQLRQAELDAERAEEERRAAEARGGRDRLFTAEVRHVLRNNFSLSPTRAGSCKGSGKTAVATGRGGETGRVGQGLRIGRGGRGRE